MAMAVEAPPRRLTPALRQARLRTAGVLSGLLAAGALANPLRPLPFEVCVFHTVTGIPCPTCGLTRALCRAIQGDFSGSLHMHPAGLIVLAVLVTWLGWSLMEAWQGRPLWETGRHRAIRAASVLAAAVTVVFWIARI